MLSILLTIHDQNESFELREIRPPQTKKKDDHDIDDNDNYDDGEKIVAEILHSGMSRPFRVERLSKQHFRHKQT